MANENKDYEGFIDFDMDTEGVHEAQPVPTAVYDLTIESAKAIYAEAEDGSGQYLKKVNVQVSIDGHPDASSIFHVLTLPKKGDDEKKRKFLVMLIKKFYKLFNVPMAPRGINTTDLLGAKATNVNIELDSYDKGDGSAPRISNKINLNNVHV